MAKVFFRAGQMPFVSPNQQCQSTKENSQQPDPNPGKLFAGLTHSSNTARLLTEWATVPL